MATGTVIVTTVGGCTDGSLPGQKGIESFAIDPDGPSLRSDGQSIGYR